MKKAIEKAGYSSLHFMCQPNGYRMETRDVLGMSELAEVPYGRFHSHLGDS